MTPRAEKDTKHLEHFSMVEVTYRVMVLTLNRVPDAVYCLTNKSTDEETAAALPIPDFEFLHQEKRITGQERAKSRTQACFYRIHMNNFHDEGAIYYRFNRTNYWNSIRLLRR
ncbi:hypothetical protein NC653_008737 [Populus alba x Populus x berolinensis]|uniref:Uncharacterized protein n=1 Tax=Populus alba x Populus x berolinensis TaxID=444605 RepID=A0AAD6R794_9ROSI|nr:hypothetical protein NC653_008737 [Populus alba x Populus x berolinensis]